jgi:hypothetical protein
MAPRWLYAVLLGAGACGPVTYINEVTRRANQAVEEARQAEAEKYAPYYWTRAVEYLREARSIAAHADYQGATRFGRLATEAAQLATEEAKLAKKDPAKLPMDQRPAPAKDTP